MKNSAYFSAFAVIFLTASLFYFFGLSAGIIAVAAIGFALLFIKTLDTAGKIDFFSQKEDAKILDATILSDPRCLDIISTGFLGSKFIIPKSVIEDFQKKASFNDERIKNDARRALDIIARLKENEKISVRVENTVAVENPSDSPLIDMAKKFNSEIVTSDYEITKVGLINGVKVLNIHDLQLSLRQSFLPGDEMTIFVVKEGKDRNQGVGYLDDGTMVVIENGYFHIGKKVEVIVQSVLKNPNSKIIFAKLK
ncbi:MAG: TRAM domain-containing protein [Elusimicrobiales bacterium]